jgi:hypothetical protein
MFRRDQADVFRVSGSILNLAKRSQFRFFSTPMGMFRRSLVVITMTAFYLQAVHAEEEEASPTKNKIEYPSPDGRLAFRYSGDPDKVGSVEDTGDKQTYDLIDKKSGKILMSVAESDESIGPSARFHMTVLWRPDSKAFAITAFLWKRGSTLFVYRRDSGADFQQIEVPELDVDIPDKEKKGREFRHMVEDNSATAKRWQKDGSLLVEVKTANDGDGYMITATRKVTLGFDQSNKAKIRNSSVKYVTEKQ